MVQKARTILMRRNKLSHLLCILSRTNPTRKGPRIANPGLHSCSTDYRITETVSIPGKEDQNFVHFLSQGPP